MIFVLSQRSFTDNYNVWIRIEIEPMTLWKKKKTKRVDWIRQNLVVDDEKDHLLWRIKSKKKNTKIRKEQAFRDVASPVILAWFLRHWLVRSLQTIPDS